MSRCRRLRLLGVCSIASGLAACGPSPEAAEPDGAVPIAAYRPCDLASKLGEFRIVLGDAFTGAEGKVLDGVVPMSVPREARTMGQCRLYTKRNLQCDPSCPGAETCGEKGCMPYPRDRSVGTVTVRGLKQPLVMKPLVPGNFYTNDSAMPHPGFDEGAVIRLETTGGDYGKFALSGWGIGPLRIPGDDIIVESGKPVRLRWEGPRKEGPARIAVNLNVSRHGGSPAWVECDGADTGSLEIPAALVTEMLMFGYAGFPSIVLTRRSADSTALGSGCVEFLVTTDVSRQVLLPGVVSCNDDTECAAGQKCQKNLTCM